MKEDQGLGFGGSLPVPSVQEIVRNDANIVPERYIQNLEDRPKSSDICPSSYTIPVIDMSLLVDGDADERRKLDLACRDWGFFQIVNHGANEAIAKMKTAVIEFFELPLSEKTRYAMAADDIQGYGQGYVVSEDQSLEWNDMFGLQVMPPELRSIEYWPESIPGFNEAVENYATELQKLACEIFANLSLILGLERDFLDQLHREVKQYIRMNYYPSCARPDLVLGFGPHSDSSTITLLVQEDDIVGLQIKHNETWVPIKPIPNAIVVNIGDLMEAWSNGRYKSIEHRAVTNVGRSRISIAAFIFPSHEVELDPLQIMVEGDDHQQQKQPMMYKNGVSFLEYMRFCLSKKHEGKKSNIGYLKLDC